LERINDLRHTSNKHHDADYEDAHDSRHDNAAERDQPGDNIDDAERDNPTPLCA
jgi:hypothetical protein